MREPTPKSNEKPLVPASNDILARIHAILKEAQSNIVRSVNTQMVRAYWLIGQEIVEEEQRGKTRAEYGEELIERLSANLQATSGKGFTPSNLRAMRVFYLTYPNLLNDEIQHPPGAESAKSSVSDDSEPTGRLNPNLSWSHYRALMRVQSPFARSFYEIETQRSHWSKRELERQIGSMLFERLALSKDKTKVMELAKHGQEIQTVRDVIKDPVVLEFLGFPETPALVESELEAALITHLQSFLLELGKGFAFVARQRRLTLDGDHFYVDLVFYHVILKCYILIDLKIDKLNHADLGQMMLYRNYYDMEIRTEGDNPTLGLILCADKNDAVVKYTLGQDNERIFASRYQFHLPTEQELADALRRELLAAKQTQKPSDNS